MQRCREIIRHHVRRLERIMEVMGEGADTPALITKELFPARKLLGAGFYAAISEVVSHLELLVDMGDIRISETGNVVGNGTYNFLSKIRSMSP